MSYTKYYPSADKRRWYVELVLHSKTEWDAEHALREYMFEDEQQLLDYHEFAGCYLKIIREQAAYERSAQGKIDILRDSIVELENDLKQARKDYVQSKRWGYDESAQLYIEHGKWLKQQILDEQRKIIKIMTGRK